MRRLTLLALAAAALAAACTSPTAPSPEPTVHFEEACGGMNGSGTKTCP